MLVIFVYIYQVFPFLYIDIQADNFLPRQGIYIHKKRMIRKMVSP